MLHRGNLYLTPIFPNFSPIFVPMTIQRVANIERAQALVESPSRKALQQFLAAWQPVLFDTRKQSEFKSLIRWAIDVEPLAI